MTRTYVTHAPRRSSGRRLFTGHDLQASIKFVERSQDLFGGDRLAIWLDTPPLDVGVDAVVCVPLQLMTDWQVVARGAVREWDDRWLLIESMPKRHRSEASEDLCSKVKEALIRAAAAGFSDCKPLEFDDFPW